MQSYHDSRLFRLSKWYNNNRSNDNDNNNNK